ncbi:MAG: hypothetical protein PF503_24340, partial [Desulfobacula sp.]|nr:hypothetical protein [Desulfobacula sp.]
MMKKKFLLQGILFLLIGFSMGFLSVVFAGEPVFQNTKDEMVKELTKKPVKYRSFVPDAQKRSIVVLERKKSSIESIEQDSITVVGSSGVAAMNSPGAIDSPYEAKTILVVDNQEMPGLKLKIEFDHNSSALRKSSFPLLRELGLALASMELKNSAVLVAGHTDSDG